MSSETPYEPVTQLIERLSSLTANERRTVLIEEAQSGHALRWITELIEELGKLDFGERQKKLAQSYAAKQEEPVEHQPPARQNSVNSLQETHAGPMGGQQLLPTSESPHIYDSRTGLILEAVDTLSSSIMSNVGKKKRAAKREAFVRRAQKGGGLAASNQPSLLADPVTKTTCIEDSSAGSKQADPLETLATSMTGNLEKMAAALVKVGYFVEGNGEIRHTWSEIMSLLKDTEHSCSLPTGGPAVQMAW